MLFLLQDNLVKCNAPVSNYSLKPYAGTTFAVLIRNDTGKTGTDKRTYIPFINFYHAYQLCTNNLAFYVNVSPIICK